MSLVRIEDRSKLPLQLMGGSALLAGAGVSAAWMFHGGGILEPLSVFAAWSTVISYFLIRMLGGRGNPAPAARQIFLALRYGGYSMLGLALGTLFLEYWPVTATMAIMFAVCRTFKNEDTQAFI